MYNNKKKKGSFFPTTMEAQTAPFTQDREY